MMRVRVNGLINKMRRGSEVNEKGFVNEGGKWRWR